MAWFKRMFLFMIVNVLVVVTISTVVSLLGLQPMLHSNGLNLGSLAVFCLIWGMVGSLISLAMSRFMAKMMTGARVIDPHQAQGEERFLVQTVYKLAEKSGLPAMPQVAIYEGMEINAFATGPTKSRSLVAVSRGLLQRMNRDEVEGVLAHEVAHIANGDMVTMTLIQGIINAFVMFFARIAAYAITSALSRSSDEREGSGGNYFLHSMLVFVFEILFSFLGMIVVAAFSRWREYRADAGGASLAGKPKMIAALSSLQRSIEMVSEEQNAVAAMKISQKPSKFFMLFSTHPPLEDRIAKLKAQ